MSQPRTPTSAPAVISVGSAKCPYCHTEFPKRGAKGGSIRWHLELSHPENLGRNLATTYNQGRECLTECPVCPTVTTLTNAEIPSHMRNNHPEITWKLQVIIVDKASSHEWVDKFNRMAL